MTLRSTGACFNDCDVTVRAAFHVSGRRAADGDNLMKLVLDAIQDAGVVGNDMRITEGHYTVDRCPKGRDRTELIIARRASWIV